jgi:hypothetical protein
MVAYDTGQRAAAQGTLAGHGIIFLASIHRKFKSTEVLAERARFFH